MVIPSRGLQTRSRRQRVDGVRRDLLPPGFVRGPVSDTQLPQTRRPLPPTAPRRGEPAPSRNPKSYQFPLLASL